ncbi:unnamed protein product [Camellia sinensis]
MFDAQLDAIYSVMKRLGNGFGNPMSENGSNMLRNSVLNDSDAIDDDTYFFPETMFPFNCVPDSALPHINRVEEDHKVDLNGVLDMLAQITTRSPIMIERLGIRPEYLSMKLLSQEQASEMSRKVIARVLTNVGFEASSEVPMEVLSQLLSCHIGKLGRILKVLSDSYRKQCSAIELLKMFLQTAGYSNLGALAELVKDSTRNPVQQTHQQMQVIQSQTESQQQAPLRQPQQVYSSKMMKMIALGVVTLQMPRQMRPQMQQMVHPQNLAFQQQQQWKSMRQRQPSTSRPGMDNIKPLVEVKLENPAEFPIDSNALTAINARHHPQLQFRQQQIAAMSNFHPEASNQFRQLASLQIPQVQTPSMGTVRAPPVKAEGFQELMGGDATLKHDSEENKSTSPPK